MVNIWPAPVAWLLLTVMVSPTSAETCSTPLPDIVLSTQAADTAQGALIGAWGNGRWDEKLCSTLVVESIANDGSVKAVYSWGHYAPWNSVADYVRCETGDSRCDVKLVDEELRFTFRTIGDRATFRLEGDSLAGRYETKQGFDAEILYQRIDLQD